MVSRSMFCYFLTFLFGIKDARLYFTFARLQRVTPERYPFIL